MNASRNPDQRSSNGLLQNLHGSTASDHLNLIRGLAAVAVLYGHARVTLLCSMDQLDQPNIVTRGLYFLSGYGHFAVIIFFVLSGFFVGTSVVRELREGRWSWRQFLIKRGARLYLVLIPGLLLTAMWDQCGLALVAGQTANTDTAIAVIDTPTIVERSDAGTLLGNALFLQTLVVPSFGSNSALWSLANEFWYYLIFPFLCLATLSQATPRVRIACLMAAGVLLWFVGSQIALYFLIWLLGVAVGVLPRLNWLSKPVWARAATWISSVLLVGVLVLLRVHRAIDVAHYGEPAIALFKSLGIDLAAPLAQLAEDALVAVVFSLFVYCLLHDQRRSRQGGYAWLATMLAGCSYSLYVTHTPLLVCLRAIWTYEVPWTPDAIHWLALTGTLGLAIAYAYVVSLLTEAHTERVRRWLLRVTSGRAHVGARFFSPARGRLG